MIELLLVQKLTEKLILLHLGSELGMLQELKMVESVWITFRATN
jgi:hypothetical protein